MSHAAVARALRLRTNAVRHRTGRSLSALTLSVVSHGHEALLERLLKDLANWPEARAAKVVVTLNRSGEPFDAAAHPALRIEVLRSARPQGFGANHNAALAHCRTPWFLVLNPDLRLPSNPFPALLAAAHCWPEAALLAPRVMGSDGRTVEDSVRAHLTPASLIQRRLCGKREPVHPDALAKRGGPFYWLAGMFLMLRCDALRAVGGFDERFFMYCEDYDLSARLWLAGHALMQVSDATVVHAAQRASHRSVRAMSWHLRSLARVWTSPAYWRVMFQSGRRSRAVHRP